MKWFKPMCEIYWQDCVEWWQSGYTMTFQHCGVLLLPDQNTAYCSLPTLLSSVSAKLQRPLYLTKYSDDLNLTILWTRRALVRWTFAAPGPRLWNSFLAKVHSAQSVFTFRSWLKTYLLGCFHVFFDSLLWLSTKLSIEFGLHKILLISDHWLVPWAL